MTQFSQNGYVACVPSMMRRYTTPGVPMSFTMRPGATATVLLYFVQRWDKEIENVDDPAGGCYNCRGIGGSGSLSNHASGTAVDINPTRHPQGQHPSLSLRSKVHAILNTVIGGHRVGDILRWGGDYVHALPDGMHIEINAPLSAVTPLAAAILAQHPPVPPPPPKPKEHEVTVFAKFNEPHPKAPALYVSNFLGRRGVVSTDIRAQMMAAGVSYDVKDVRGFSTDAGMNAYAGPLLPNADGTFTDYNPATGKWETH